MQRLKNNPSSWNSLPPRAALVALPPTGFSRNLARTSPSTASRSLPSRNMSITGTTSAGATLTLRAISRNARTTTPALFLAEVSTPRKWSLMAGSSSSAADRPTRVSRSSPLLLIPKLASFLQRCLLLRNTTAPSRCVSIPIPLLSPAQPWISTSLSPKRVFKRNQPPAKIPVKPFNTLLWFANSANFGPFTYHFPHPSTSPLRSATRGSHPTSPSSPFLPTITTKSSPPVPYRLCKKLRRLSRDVADRR